MPVPAWREAISGFDVLAVALSAGVSMALTWLLPASAEQPLWRANIRCRLRWLGVIAFALLTLTTVAVLVSRSIAISGRQVMELGGIIPLVLTHTSFGWVWIARAVAVILLWFVWSRIKPDRHQPRVYIALLVFVMVVAFTRSATGHPGGHGDFRIAVWMDWLHLLAAGLWGGVILAYVVAVRPVLGRDEQAQRAVVVARFSTLAAVGLGLAAATGIYSAWYELGGWRPLWTTRYGLILDIKVGLVILMALLGASNRFWHVPAVVEAGTHPGIKPDEDRSGLRLLTVTVVLEAVVFLAILAVVALLVNGMPPADVR